VATASRQKAAREAAVAPEDGSLEEEHPRRTRSRDVVPGS